MSPTTDTLPITIDVLLGPDEWNAGLRSDALAGLTATPKTLTPTWLYDDTGSALYDAITRLPEYNPARTEQSILDRWAPEMVAITGPDTVVELGSGTSDKTRSLLDAMAASGTLDCYVPFDVARARDYGRDGPGVEVDQSAARSGFRGRDYRATVDHRQGADDRQ